MRLLFTGKSLTRIMVDLPISSFIHQQMLRAIALQRWGEVDIRHWTQSEKTLPEERAGYINRKENTGWERQSAFPQVIRQVLDKARNRAVASWAPSIPQHTWSPTWLGCRHRSRVETPHQCVWRTAQQRPPHRSSTFTLFRNWSFSGKNWDRRYYTAMTIF